MKNFSSRGLIAVAAAFGSLLLCAAPAPAKKASWHIKEASRILKESKNGGEGEKAGADKALDYLEKTMREFQSSKMPEKEINKIRKELISICWCTFNDRFEGYFEDFVRANPDCDFKDEVLRARHRIHYRALQDAKKFPLDEKDIKFGQTLESMGVKDGKTVHLKDYWNPTNVTEAFQKLVDDPSVTTIVLDKMPTPWYINTVEFGEKVTGKRVLLKSGVKLMRCPEFLRHRMGKNIGRSMLEINSAQNIIIESDAENPEDVLLGYYESYAERAKWNKREGRSGISIGHKNYQRPTRNIVIRNIRIADCECDGIVISGLWDPPEEIFVENVILDSNFRQGTSPCAYYSLYFKNVKFLNTRGGPPSAGVDVEPWDDYLATANLYFFDCTFGNNYGGGLYLATTTHDPVLVHIKRCRFLPTYGSQIDIIAMPISYFNYKSSPISKIIVEDCEFDSTGPTLTFHPCPVYNLTMKNCVIRDARSAARKKSSLKGPAPVTANLNRDFGVSDYPEGTRPEVRFENVRVEGFEKSDFLAVSDELGMMSMKNVFSGVVDWNGGKFDCSKVSYDAPDINEPKTQLMDSSKFVKPAKIPAQGEAMGESNAKLCFNGAWWLKFPIYSYYFYAEKGREVSFDFEYGGEYPWIKTPLNEIFIVSAEGKNVSLGKAVKGKTNIKYVAPDTGYHRFTPGLQLDLKSGFGSGIVYSVSNVKGAYFAWQADTYRDSFAKFVLKDSSKPYTGYFEVPAGGRECRIRVNFGGFVLKDPAGNVVDAVDADEYTGRHIFKIRPSTDKAEIWSFTTPCTPAGGATRGLRFYAPLNGIWADAPEMLPCEFAEHFTPEKKKVARASAGAVKLDKSALPEKVLAVIEKAKDARREFGAKKEYAILKKEVEDQIFRMRSGRMSDDVQHQIEDLTRSVKLRGRLAEMERRAASEEPSVFEAVAFCQEFLPLVALDEKARADFIEWKTSGKNLSAFPKLSAEINSPRFEEKVHDELIVFKIDNPDGIIEYNDESRLPELVDVLTHAVRLASK